MTASIHTLTPLEQDRTQTLLGLRFWDRLTDQIIGQGLRVTAQRLSSDRTQRLGKPIPGTLTPNGTIAFFGLSPTEKSNRKTLDPTNQLWENPPPAQLVAIDMVDTRSRFLPLSFVAQLPFRGPFLGHGSWLTETLHKPKVSINETLGIQLWSAPTRSIPPGRAIIRGQLIIGQTNQPVAHALVRIQLANRPDPTKFDHYGLTDAQGNLIIPMPYPAIPDPPSAADPYPPLDQQQFTLRIMTRYSQTQTTLPGSSVPNLETLLTQPLAKIIRRITTSNPPRLGVNTVLTADLQFGQTLILKTDETPNQSVLRIQPQPPP